MCYLLLWVLQAHHQLELLGMLLLQMEIFTRPLLPFISFVANETSWWSGFWRMDTHTYPCPAALLLVTCIYTHPSAFLANNFHMFYPNWPYYFICELTLVFKVMLKAFIFILNFWLCLSIFSCFSMSIPLNVHKKKKNATDIALNLAIIYPRAIDKTQSRVKIIWVALDVLATRIWLLVARWR